MLFSFVDYIDGNSTLGGDEIVKYAKSVQAGSRYSEPIIELPLQSPLLQNVRGQCHNSVPERRGASQCTCRMPCALVPTSPLLRIQPLPTPPLRLTSLPLGLPPHSHPAAKTPIVVRARLRRERRTRKKERRQGKKKESVYIADAFLSCLLIYLWWEEGVIE